MVQSLKKTQLAFDQTYFMPTILLRDSMSSLEKEQAMHEFVRQHDFPVILKSDVGCVEKVYVKFPARTTFAKRLPYCWGTIYFKSYELTQRVWIVLCS